MSPTIMSLRTKNKKIFIVLALLDTPEHVMSGGARLRDLAPGQHRNIAPMATATCQYLRKFKRTVSQKFPNVLHNLQMRTRDCV